MRDSGLGNSGLIISRLALGKYESRVNRITDFGGNHAPLTNYLHSFRGNSNR